MMDEMGVDGVELSFERHSFGINIIHIYVLVELFAGISNHLQLFPRVRILQSAQFNKGRRMHFLIAIKLKHNNLFLQRRVGKAFVGLHIFYV